ncbi:MAG: metallophosphoesterase [Clostridiales bacterium]|nr:metallophosphoesterase [Clostridiales bacterium]
MTKKNRKSAGKHLLILAFALILGAAGCGKRADSDLVESGQERETDPSEGESAPENPSERETGEPESDEPETTIEPFPQESLWEEDDGQEEGEDDEEENGWDEDWEGRLILATDIHYLSRELTDGGEAFQYMVDHGDGKVVTYVEAITDAFLEEVIRRQPDVLILSGDLTLDGEKQSHEELAEKLYEVEDSGIPVLIIPGNHDINNHHAARFEGNSRKPAEFTTPEEFREIYRDFGYDEAISEDRTSLSYLYEYDEETWFLMIDSCQYARKALVGGAIMPETYDWIEECLEEAWDEGIHVIPVAHHNLLDESEIYVDDCTIEHGEQLADILEEWDVSSFLSGHLHVQHAKRSGGNRGVWEMVTSSLATPACQYGVMEYRHNGDFHYYTQSVDVERWAKVHQRTEQDLLEFDTFKEPFLRRVFYNQSYDALSKIDVFTENQRVRMSNFYSNLNYYYYQGNACKIVEEVENDPDYELWLEDGALSVLGDYVVYIIEDAKMDYNTVLSE